MLFSHNIINDITHRCTRMEMAKRVSEMERERVVRVRFPFMISASALFNFFFISRLMLLLYSLMVLLIHDFVVIVFFLLDPLCLKQRRAYTYNAKSLMGKRKGRQKGFVEMKQAPSYINRQILHTSYIRIIELYRF